MQKIINHKKILNDIKKDISTIFEGDYIFFYNNEIIDSSFNKKNIIIKDNTKLYFTNNTNNAVNIIYTASEKTNLNIEYHINKNVKVDLYESYLNIDSDLVITKKIVCLENGIFNYISFLNAKKNTFIRHNSCMTLSYKSYIMNKNLTLSNGIIESVSDVYLKDSHAYYDMDNTIINTSGSEQIFKYNIYHEKGNSISTLNNYGICTNSSKIKIDSNGKIHKGASKTNLNQKSKGLILDSNSWISANPLLEIDEYDVIASHGASIGAIDENDLYYMMSRGLTKESAENVIIQGLVYPYTSAFPKGKLQDYVIKRIKKYL